MISINLFPSSSKKSFTSFVGRFLTTSNIPDSLLNLVLIFSFIFDELAL